MLTPIFYLYSKQDGRFLGSGTARIDNDNVGCTLRPPEADLEEDVEVYNPAKGSWTRGKLPARKVGGPADGRGANNTERSDPRE